MSIEQRAFVLLFAVATAVPGAGCQKQYPNCKAFEFSGAGREPRLLDDDASPEDCGRVRVQGSMVTGSAALDCALEHIAEGSPMKLSLDMNPESEVGESWTVFSDEDGLAMRRRDLRMDLSGQREAKVYALDMARVGDCRELEEASERASCLADAFDAAEVVKSCFSERTQSE